MWKCRKCGGEVVGTGEDYTKINFELDEDGDITEVRDVFVLNGVVKEALDAFCYCCEDCWVEVDSVSDLGEIAEWVEEEEIMTYLERMLEEREQLEDRIYKLRIFLDKETKEATVTTEEDRRLLALQWAFMENYKRVLDNRIARAEKK